MICKICKSKSETLFASKTKILKKYPIEYFRCTSCGFIQTEEPYWLDEAYSSAITTLDIGLISRNLRISQQVNSLISAMFSSKGPFLDYGGGYGMLVRMMRDIGYDYYRFDTHCENLFSVHFDVEDSKSQKFELITAFEVFEHLLDPIEETRKMLEFGDSIFLSTELIPNRPITQPGDWWYFTPETGQHIAIYSSESLRKLAEHHKCNFYTDGKTLHLITKREINPLIFKLAIKNKVSALVSTLTNRKSLLDSDFNDIRTMLNKSEV